MSASHAAHVEQQKAERDARAAARKWAQVDREEEATPAPAPAPAPDPDDLATYHPDVPHICGDFCKRHCVFGGNGPPNWCRFCELWRPEHIELCQRCVCLSKENTGFKDRPGGTCAACVTGGLCQCPE